LSLLFTTTKVGFRSVLAALKAESKRDFIIATFNFRTPFRLILCVAFGLLAGLFSTAQAGGSEKAEIRMAADSPCGAMVADEGPPLYSWPHDGKWGYVTRDGEHCGELGSLYEDRAHYDQAHYVYLDTSGKIVLEQSWNE
jgi:hypothetical protein